MPENPGPPDGEGQSPVVEVLASQAAAAAAALSDQHVRTQRPQFGYLCGQLSLPAGGVISLLAEQAITCLMQATRARSRRLPTARSRRPD
jgi:hypothetical protein